MKDRRDFDRGERKILVGGQSFEKRPEDTGRSLGIAQPGVEAGVQPLEEFDLGVPGGVADYCGRSHRGRPGVLGR
jgi:hypothetical protein